MDETKENKTSLARSQTLRASPSDRMRGWLRVLKRNRSDEGKEITSEVTQTRDTHLLTDPKINNQKHPDVFYTSAFERLSVGIANWTVSHFRSKQPKAYTDRDVSIIRLFLRNLFRLDSTASEHSIWEKVDLESALVNSKFRLAFVLHLIGFCLHVRVFSPFSYDLPAPIVSQSLKQISDQVVIQENQQVAWEWNKLLMSAIAQAFDGNKNLARLLQDLRTVLQAVHPDSAPNEEIFESLKPIISLAVEISTAMRYEMSRFVSIFPATGNKYLPELHSTGAEGNSEIVELCTFPGIIKQRLFAECSPEDVIICKAKVYGSGTFEILKVTEEIENNGT